MAHSQTYNHIQTLRFPEFQKHEEWELKRLGDIAIRMHNKNRSDVQHPVLTNSATGGIVNQQEYFDREIVTKENLKNYSIVELNDFVYNPRISMAAPVGPISRNKIGLGIMSPLYTIFRFKEGNIDFFEQYFKTNCWHQYLKDIANFGARFDRMNIASEDFMNLPIPFPPLAEQERIAESLSSMDETIAECNNKLELLKSHKKGLMQKLFPPKGQKVPRLRLKGFEKEGEWGEKKIGELFDRVIRKNTENNQTVLTISAQYGLVSQYDYFNKNVAALDVTNYYLINKGDFAYNKSRSQGYPYGAIKSLRLYDKGVVSTLYICFRIKKDINCSIDFFEHYFETDLINDEIGKIAQEGARNHGLLNISTDDFFNKISIIVPSFLEQKKIAECLSSTDKMISYYTEKLSLLEQHKKGLMQQLFPKDY